MKDLKQLGQITEVPAIRDAATLEKIDNPSPNRFYEVKLHSKEFTSLCPVITTRAAFPSDFWAAAVAAAAPDLVDAPHHQQRTRQ